MSRAFAAALLTATLVSASGCSDHDHILGLPLFRMYEQSKNKPYTLSDVFPDGRQMLLQDGITKGELFAWTVFDYPLKQAILDGIVKRPIKGISKIEEAKSDIANVRYQGFLTAGVQRCSRSRHCQRPQRSAGNSGRVSSAVAGGTW